MLVAIVSSFLFETKQFQLTLRHFNEIEEARSFIFDTLCDPPGFYFRTKSNAMRIEYHIHKLECDGEYTFEDGAHHTICKIQESAIPGRDDYYYGQSELYVESLPDV